MASLRALYLNFKDDFGDLLEVTDFSIATWLAFGAGLQLLSQSWLPSGLSYWLPLLYLTYRIARVSFDCRRIFTGTFTNVVFGRWSATLPEPEDPSAVTATSDGVVMFLLGARINHPLGKLAPGNAEIDKVFKGMWVEAEKNRRKWSYLGRTATLFDISDSEGITTFWISYWKDLKGLQEYATSSAHRLGQNGYLTKKFPYMGVMHETYHSPKGSWEAIYDNMPPLGFGKAKYVIGEGPDGFKLGDTLKPSPRTSTMYGRMGREKVGMVRGMARAFRVVQYKDLGRRPGVETKYYAIGASDVESERREGDDSHDPLRISSTSTIWPLSPLINYPSFPNPTQSIPIPEQDFLDGDHGGVFDGGDRSVLHSADLNFPDFEGLERAESRRPWADAPDDCWNSSSPGINQQLSSGPADTDTPLSAYSHSSVFETNKPISLDAVAARLEETAGSTIAHFERRQPTLCRCLRKYADVLCKLQTIEKRQRPVQADTLLTCANLVLNITENQLKCTQCLYDSCVVMQLVMIFQTIFTWSQGQCHPPGTPGPDLRMTLGQHEMTEEECSFVKTALISKALDRTGALLKLMMSRIEHVTLNRQGKQSRGHEGAEFWNLQQLVGSLVQSFGVLTESLASGQSRSRWATEGWWPERDVACSYLGFPAAFTRWIAREISMVRGGPQVPRHDTCDRGRRRKWAGWEHKPGQCIRKLCTLDILVGQVLRLLNCGNPSARTVVFGH